MKPIPKEIRQAANQAAHRLAWTFEGEVRRSLFSKLDKLVNSGATSNQLAQALAQFEAHPKQ